MLKVVQHEKQFFGTQMAEELCLRISSIRNVKTDRIGDRRNNMINGLQGCECHKPNTVEKRTSFAFGQMECEVGFADPARSYQRQQPAIRICQQLFYGL